MSPRSIRRAAERKANKLARKAARQLQTEQLPAMPVNPSEELDFDPPDCLASFPLPEPHPEPTTRKAISPARVAANRANAQLSVGPTSPEGKAKSSLNAVTTALTGRTVLLATDDAAQYQQHLRNFEKELKPATPGECALVQSLADTAWRLDRIPGLELAIFARGRIQFADRFNDHDPALRPRLIELETFLTYEKQLRNLQLQEARLHRRREKDTAELRRLQDERNRREREELEMAAKLYVKAQHDHTPFNPSDHGFEFSTADVEAFLDGIRAANLLNASLKNEYRRARAEAQAA